MNDVPEKYSAFSSALAMRGPGALNAACAVEGVVVLHALRPTATITAIKSREVRRNDMAIPLSIVGGEIPITRES